MIQEVIIAAFVLVALHDIMSGRSPVLSGPDWMIWTASILPTVMLHLVCHARIAALGRRLDRYGDVAAVYQAERIMLASRFASLAILAFNVIALGWVGRVQSLVGTRVVLDTLVAVSPVLLTVLAGWWWFYPIEVRLREASLVRTLDSGGDVVPIPSRLAYVTFWARHTAIPALLPIVTIMAWVEIVELAWLRYDVFAHLGEGTRVALQAIGVAAFLAVAPLVLRYVWETLPLPPGEVRDRLAAVCVRNRVRVRELLLWRTAGTIHNAAVLGILPRARFILVTDAMVANMPGEYLEAVASHEVGHVRLRHLPWLAASTLASVLTTALVLGWIAWAVLDWLVQGPWANGASGGVSDEQYETLHAICELAVSLGSLLGALVAFGWISRRFEWQADAFAARDLSVATGDGERISPDAAARMIGALGRVAAFNGISPGRFMWRHGSIRTRQKKLTGLVGLPSASLPIDRQVRAVKIATVITIVGLAAAALCWPEIASM